MSTAERFIGELTSEAATTRRVLERVPAEKFSWRPHPKSMSLGQLALHIAAMPGGVAELMTEPVAQVPRVPLPEPNSVDELTSTLDKSVATVTAKLNSWGDDGLRAEWTMMAGNQTILAMPRRDMVRSVILNHWYHHRGQLTVYLRLLDVAVPSVYGPTADENPFK